MVANSYSSLWCFFFLPSSNHCYILEFLWGLLEDLGFFAQELLNVPSGANKLGILDGYVKPSTLATESYWFPWFEGESCTAFPRKDKTLMLANVVEVEDIEDC